MTSPEDRAAAYIAKMEPAIQGSGGSAACSNVACKLVEFGLDRATALRRFQEYNLLCQPPWSERDLIRKLAWAANRTQPKMEFASDLSPHDFQQSARPVEPAWPVVDEELRTAVLDQGRGEADLVEQSCDFMETSMEYLNLLFPNNPLLCCGLDNSRFQTKPLSDWWKEASAQQLVVPSPMSDLTGITLEGNVSAHCIGNTGPRRFAVTEFDAGTVDEQCAILLHLGGYAPLVMVVHSGGKSLHGWFFVAGQSEDKIKRFYRYAVSLGADHHTHLRTQFVRMPEGTRPKGGIRLRQPVYFFRPERIK